MDVATELMLHLEALSRQGDGVDGRPARDVAVGLAALARELSAEIPSCLSVSLVLTRPAGEITISLAAPGLVEDRAAVVQASLAVPLSTSAPGAVLLLLQAAQAGAFLLMAGDLTGQRGPQDPPLLVDQHLVLVSDSGGRLATELADLRVLDQAVGALIDQGWPPAQARQELHERARAAGVSPPRLARQLLDALPGSGATADP